MPLKAEDRRERQPPGGKDRPRPIAMTTALPRASLRRLGAQLPTASLDRTACRQPGRSAARPLRLCRVHQGTSEACRINLCGRLLRAQALLDGNTIGHPTSCCRLDPGPTTPPKVLSRPSPQSTPIPSARRACSAKLRRASGSSGGLGDFLRRRATVVGRSVGARYVAEGDDPDERLVPIQHRQTTHLQLTHAARSVLDALVGEDVVDLLARTGSPPAQRAPARRRAAEKRPSAGRSAAARARGPGARLNRRASFYEALCRCGPDAGQRSARSEPAYSAARRPEL
jgi:hypothetical protein